ncbi:MAG: SDR family NAD(P)-dependent oxidoreductase [Chloroflexi bacterium]|nr:SDR family NAD(P)-dependent oxidoreductase [Chloroflexota bacterium]MBP8058365.1 SDR family NAD(P)-dependent oxidoreductase [Chloroflexota bacterium]
MKNKTILITGATSGIGYQTALALAQMGAHVVLTGRNAKTAAEAVSSLKSASGNPRVDFLLADFTQQAEIHALAETFKQKYPCLDVLINNAGLAAPERQLTPDGIEANFAVNVVAPFLLAHLLMDALKSAPAPRVITLMGGDVPAQLDLDNLQAERSFDGLNSYSQSKLAMMVVMYEFARREKGVTFNVCYPGQASTNMTRSVTANMLPGFMRFIFPLFRLMVRPDNGKSAAKAARSSIYLASSPDVAGISGKYYNTKSQSVEWPSAVLDAPTRQKLWKMVVGLTHVKEGS